MVLSENFQWKFEEIMSKHNNKAQDPENIPSKYIKVAGEFIATTLSDLFNKFVIEKFPSQLKLAKVKLIHNSGLTKLLTNYCPSQYRHLLQKFLKN